MNLSENVRLLRNKQNEIIEWVNRHQREIDDLKIRVKALEEKSGKRNWFKWFNKLKKEASN